MACEIALKDKQFADFVGPMHCLLKEAQQTHLTDLKQSFQLHLSQYLQIKSAKTKSQKELDWFNLFDTGKIKLNRYRQKDVIQLRDIINQACTTEDLITNVQAHLATMHRGFFGRSQLADQLNDAINDYYMLAQPKQPALK
jgi:hypothetical protein